MSVNKVIVLGRTGKDVELKYTAGGMAIANFTVATSEKWKDKDGQKQEKTEWHNITFFGKQAEICDQFVKKGDQVYVEGRLETQKYEKDGVTKYVTKILGQTIQFLGGKKDGETKPTTVDDNSAYGGTNYDPTPTQSKMNFTADDIPF